MKLIVFCSCVCAFVFRPCCCRATPPTPPAPVALCVSCLPKRTGDGAASGGLLHMAGYTGGTFWGALWSVFRNRCNKSLCVLIFITLVFVCVNSNEEPAAALQGACH